VVAVPPIRGVSAAGAADSASEASTAGGGGIVRPAPRRETDDAPLEVADGVQVRAVRVGPGVILPDGVEREAVGRFDRVTGISVLRLVVVFAA
jgi:hypothetical protein